MKLLALPAPLQRLRRLPVAYRITHLALRVRALLVRRERPAGTFDAADFDFNGLAADAPNWLAELTARND
jgi:hypothetical protein